MVFHAGRNCEALGKVISTPTYPYGHLDGNSRCFSRSRIHIGKKEIQANIGIINQSLHNHFFLLFVSSRATFHVPGEFITLVL